MAFCQEGVDALLGAGRGQYVDGARSFPAGVDARVHAFVTADVRAFLQGAREQAKQWDLIVSDPPSFAPSEKALARATQAYRALHRACADVLAPGGVFLCKVLQGGTEAVLLAELKRDFASVKHVKPPASRADSAELYLLARGFRG